ncbi:hypothetical protein SRHO_G00044620 [Serrasalmus rhombeus]
MAVLRQIKIRATWRSSCRNSFVQTSADSVLLGAVVQTLVTATCWEHLFPADRVFAECLSGVSRKACHVAVTSLRGAIINLLGSHKPQRSTNRDLFNQQHQGLSYSFILRYRTRRGSTTSSQALPGGGKTNEMYTPATAQALHSSSQCKHKPCPSILFI